MAAIAQIPALNLEAARRRSHRESMSDESENPLASRAAIAAGAAIGSAAVAAALLFVKRRKDKERAKNALPPPTSKAPHFPPETD